MKAKNYIGHRFNRLIAMERIRKYNGKRWNTFYKCICNCGKEIITRGQSLVAKNTQSCGCLNYDNHYLHGHTKNQNPSPTFHSWENAISRCYNKNDKSYNRYGGRGIIICDRWKNSFKNFLEDMGERPAGMTLERINANGNYEPLNCKWATISEQNRNKSNSIKITFNNTTKTASEWARDFGVNASTIARRFKACYPIDKDRAHKKWRESINK